MRFAYIDSQGNEVQIPSEDALRLRIELGAIVESTSFFDGEGSGWAPARDHEIYRRLRRDLEGVADPAPLPVGELGPEGSPPAAPSVQAEFDAADELLAGEEGGFERVIDFDAPGSQFEVEAFAPEGASPSPEESIDADDDFGLDVLDGFGALDLQVPDALQPRASTPAPESPEPSFADATRPPEPHDDADDPWTVPGRDPWAPEADAAPARPDSMEGVGFGDEPAPPSDAATHPFDADEEIPDWLRNDPEFGADRTKASAVPDVPAPSFPTREEVRERYEHDLQKPSTAGGSRPPARPSAPRRGASKSPTRLLLGVVVVAALAAGGWYVTRGGDLSSASGDSALIELPDISPTLLPVSVAASERAQLATVAALRAMPAREAVPEEPHADWLAGQYMANAGEYSAVRLYWEAMGRYVQVMRAREGEMFAAELTTALDTVPLAADDRSQVEARSQAGFAASATERDAVYAQLRAVADAALRLQVFLEQNQDQIDYDPVASGLSRDPVLEAVPVTAELGEEMWNRVADITSALDALGFLDKVTTDQLLDVFFDKLAAVAVR